MIDKNEITQTIRFYNLFIGIMAKGFRYLPFSQDVPEGTTEEEMAENRENLARLTFELGLRDKIDSSINDIDESLAIIIDKIGELKHSHIEEDADA